VHYKSQPDQTHMRENTPMITDCIRL